MIWLIFQTYISNLNFKIPNTCLFLFPFKNIIADKQIFIFILSFQNFHIIFVVVFVVA